MTRKWDRKISNQLDQKETLQEKQDCLATAEAQAFIPNQGNYDIIAKINDIGATTHDKWYNNLRNRTPYPDQWHYHVAVNKTIVPLVTVRM